VQPSPFGAGNTQVVVLNLPAHAIPPPVIEVNANGEILAINKQNLAPMSSDGVKNLFSQIVEARAKAPALADF
jgi:hypothetical protein